MNSKLMEHKTSVITIRTCKHFKKSNKETKGTVLQDYKHVIIIVPKRLPVLSILDTIKGIIVYRFLFVWFGCCCFFFGYKIFILTHYDIPPP